MDILTYGLLNKKVEEAKNVSGEKITEAVNTYLDENPPTTGATAEQAAQIDKNVADIDGLKGDLDDIINIGNRFDINACSYNIRLKNETGAETQVEAFITSNYIDVEDVKSIVTNDTLYSLAFYNANHEVITVLGTLGPGRRHISSYAAKYIRFSIQNEKAKTFVLTFDDETSMSTQYGYVPTKRLSNVDISKEYAELRNESNTENNILDSSTYYMQKGVGYDDYHYTNGNAKSIKMLARNGSNLLDCRITPSSTISVEGICSFVVEFFVENASNITNVVLELIGTSFLKSKTLTEGWNKIIFNTFEGSVANWNTCTKIRLYFGVSGDCTVWLSSIKAIRNDKARIIVIDDHSYSNFKTIAYPRLKALGVPVTWALDPGRLGKTPTTECGAILSQDEINVLAYDPFSEFSIHAWDSSTPTSEMTESEILEDTHKCITYLKKNGIAPNHIWRAAWTQNRAPHANSAYGLMDGCATSTDEVGLCAYPIQNMYSIPRYSLHNRTLSDYQGMFDILKKTHALLVCYTHSINDNGGINMTNDELDNFISCISTALSEGWIKATTFSRMITEG